METKLVRIAEISATSKHPIFTSVYHLINEDMLKQCHKELDGSKAVGIDKVTKDEYGKNLDRNIKDLVQRLKNKSFKPLPSLRVYIPKANGKKRPLGIASYEDKIVQMAVKKILGAIYEPRFLNCMYGFRPNRGCHEAIKEVYQRISYGKISYIVDADIKGFFDHIDHEWMMKFLEWNIQDTALLGFNNYSLEHLMPKKWRNNWGACATEDDAKKRDSLLLTLGNLAIIPQALNASIRDAAWNVKKAGKGQNKPGLLLCASGLYTLHDVLQKNDWNEDEIENRAEWLLANAQNIWKI